MTSDHAEYQRKFKALQDNFLAELVPKAQQIRAQWRQLEQQWQPQARDALYLIVHRLAGAGETFGFPELSQRARTLDRLLQTCEAGRTPSPQEIAQMRTAAQELLALMAALANGPAR